MRDSSCSTACTRACVAFCPAHRGRSQRLAPDSARTTSWRASCHRLPSARSSTASMYRSPTISPTRSTSSPACTRTTESAPGRSGCLSGTGRSRTCSSGVATNSTPTRRRWCWSSSSSTGSSRPDVEIEVDPDIAEIARMNDVAYGFEGDFVRAFGELPESATHRYAAVLGGQRVAGMLTLDHRQDCLRRIRRHGPGSARTRPGERAHDTCAARCARARLHDEQPPGDQVGSAHLRAARLPRSRPASDVGEAQALARPRSTLPEVKKKALRAE